MGDYILVIGPRVIRGRGNAVNLPISYRIFPHFYNELLETSLPNSNHPSGIRMNGDFITAATEGHNAARLEDEIWVGIRGDSAAQFGDQGDFQSCAE